MAESTPGIDELASAAVEACRAAYPDVRLARERVVEGLARLDLAMLERARLGELCLVWACLGGDAAAHRVIDRSIRAEAQRVARELRQPEWLVDEIHQELAQRLLVAAPGAEPRLATYSGQAVLGRWLGVAAMRTALNLTRRDRRETPLPGDSVAAAITAPELALVRHRYRDAVQSAIRAAFDALDNPRDRNLLRLYYVDRVGLERLGQMFNVHGSTISRWLTALREAIFEDTSARLGERLGMAGEAAEIESLIRAVRSDLDLTLSQILT
jgi:RNA polymerase sigma-70 factor (ECF subfamily)